MSLPTFAAFVSFCTHCSFCTFASFRPFTSFAAFCTFSLAPPLSQLGYGSKDKDLSFVSGMCIVATISMVPCLAQFRLFFFLALPDECVTLSVNSGMRMKMRSKFPRQRTRKHNKKPNKHHKPNPKNKNPRAKPVVPREMQTR